MEVLLQNFHGDSIQGRNRDFFFYLSPSPCFLPSVCLGGKFKSAPELSLLFHFHAGNKKTPNSAHARSLTHLVDPDWLGGGAQPAFAQRPDADDVVILLPGEGQLGGGVGRGERVYLLVPLPPVGQLRKNKAG